MLHANAKFSDGTPFEDYSLFLYRQTAPKFEDRVKEMENKILYPVRSECRSVLFGGVFVTVLMLNSFFFNGLKLDVHG